MTKAILINEPGDSESLEFKDIKIAKPKEGEVLITHKAIGINFIDIHYRRGDIKFKSYPIVPGIEAAGYIEEIGEGVTGFKVGDRVVYGSIQSGAYSEQRVIDTKYLVVIPDDITYEQAAACFTKGITAHYLLKRVFYVRAGNYILIQAACGGVGHILSQWANSLKARVIGVVGSDDKVEIAKAIGCRYVIKSDSENFLEKIKEYTNNENISVAYDSVGKDTIDKSLNSLGKYGLLVSYGSSSGMPIAFDLKKLSKKSLFVTSPDLFSYKENRNELILSASDVFENIRTGIIKLKINEYKFDQIKEIHRNLEERKTIGSNIISL